MTYQIGDIVKFLEIEAIVSKVLGNDLYQVTAFGTQLPYVLAASSLVLVKKAINTVPDASERYLTKPTSSDNMANTRGCECGAWSVWWGFEHHAAWCAAQGLPYYFLEHE